MTFGRISGRASRAIVVLLVLAAAFMGEGVAHAASKPVVFAVGGWAFPTRATLARLHHAGLRTWRLTMSWTDVAPTGPNANFSGYDVVMRAAAKNHIQVMVTLTGCPAWACPQGGPPVRPAALAGFRRFARKAVRRYGHRGSVWRSHPRFPVVYWQVFNEVNGSDQWPPRPRTAAYARVLRATAWTIRHADRRAKVVLAGLGEKMTVWLRSYLPGLYRRKGFRRSFDVMAVEGYAVHARDTARILTRTRRIMRRFHDARKPLFVTEMGWSTGGPPFPFTTTPAGQAARLKTSWRQLAACRSRWRLKRVYWFAYSDAPAPASTDYWGFHNGLVDLSGAFRPAYYAFKRFLRPARAARAAGRCHR